MLIVVPFSKAIKTVMLLTNNTFQAPLALEYLRIRNGKRDHNHQIWRLKCCQVIGIAVWHFFVITITISLHSNFCLSNNCRKGLPSKCKNRKGIPQSKILRVHWNFGVRNWLWEVCLTIPGRRVEKSPQQGTIGGQRTEPAVPWAICQFVDWTTSSGRSPSKTDFEVFLDPLKNRAHTL